MISRRTTLGVLAGASLAPGLAFATVPARKGRRFALVILRGAMDGLSAAAPLADPDYASLRGNLSLGTPQAPNGALPLDGRFWLHPSLAPLHPLYERGEFTIVHAMASPYRERSHFDGQNMVETGMVRPGMGNNGWLNRTLAALGGDGIGGVAFAPSLPLVLKGHAPAANWQPGGLRTDLQEAVLRMYDIDPPLRAAYAQGVATHGMVDSLNAQAPRGRDFRSLGAVAGTTLAAEGGPNIAVLEIGGWDTHVGQGAAKGRLAGALQNLAAGLEAMRQSLGARWAETVVVAVTEFGRTAHPNGTGGTDHGTATAGFALGGALAGGRVIADWPGLSKQALYQDRDLAPTTDLRSFLKAILGDHLGVTSAALEGQIFPDSAAARPMHGLIRT
jgi:uncharacterized protein (DUF1501 family)